MEAVYNTFVGSEFLFRNYIIEPGTIPLTVRDPLFLDALFCVPARSFSCHRAFYIYPSTADPSPVYFTLLFLFASS